MSKLTGEAARVPPKDSKKVYPLSWKPFEHIRYEDCSLYQQNSYETMQVLSRTSKTMDMRLVRTDTSTWFMPAQSGGYRIERYPCHF